MCVCVCVCVCVYVYVWASKFYCCSVFTRDSGRFQAICAIRNSCMWLHIFISTCQQEPHKTLNYSLTVHKQNRTHQWCVTSVTKYLGMSLETNKFDGNFFNLFLISKWMWYIPPPPPPPPNQNDNNPIFKQQIHKIISPKTKQKNGNMGWAGFSLNPERWPRALQRTPVGSRGRHIANQGALITPVGSRGRHIANQGALVTPVGSRGRHIANQGLWTSTYRGSDTLQT